MNALLELGARLSDLERSVLALAAGAVVGELVVQLARLLRRARAKNDR
ncbi:hypothetical protein [Corallococcus silvisoli]|nr:hypothetical protein [Corallococcus silvisoli]NBD09643.1 hypothetical protein [Corallococcus silvisoli]